LRAETRLRPAGGWSALTKADGQHADGQHADAVLGLAGNLYHPQLGPHQRVAD